MRPALVIVDMQNDFVLPNAAACVRGADATVPYARKALTCFRRRALPVFHVYREYDPDGSDVELARRDEFLAGGGYVLRGTRGAQIIEQLAPIRGEYQVSKRRFSAFLGTTLDLLLRRLAISDIVLCGTQYPNCIRATAYDAVSLDYAVTVLMDATSAASLEVAAANIRDMEAIGVRFVTAADFERAHMGDDVSCG